MEKKSNNDLLMLGISILIIGLSLAAYSFSTYKEGRYLETKIEFDLVDGNNELSSTEKYYKYLSFADFLTQKLDKNKNIPIKNASCIYLDYAQHNALELYELTSKRMDSDESKKNVAAGNIRNIYNTLDSYNTCKQTSEYKTQLKNILDKIENSDKVNSAREQQMEEILSNYKERQRMLEQEQQTSSQEEAPKSEENPPQSEETPVQIPQPSENKIQQ